jgi:hypothetical protein
MILTTTLEDVKKIIVEQKITTRVKYHQVRVMEPELGLPQIHTRYSIFHGRIFLEVDGIPNVVYLKYVKITNLIVLKNTRSSDLSILNLDYHQTQLKCSEQHGRNSRGMEL